MRITYSSSGKQPGDVEDDVPYMGSAIFMHGYGRRKEVLVYKKTDSRSRLFVFDILLVKIFEIFSDKIASLLYAVNRTQWV